MSAIKNAYWDALKKYQRWRERIDLVRLKIANRIRRQHVVGSGAAVVSLTSYGDRIDTVYLTLESIGRGSVRPSRLILWLDDETVFQNPPEKLVRLKARGVEVMKCEDLGPHKKYYPYVEGSASFELPLVTADDDVIYPTDWLSRLIEEHERTPQDVICYRAREVKFSESGLALYQSWKMCNSATSSVRHVATRVSGVLYPPGLQMFLKSAGRQFLNCCPRADDLWLHVNAVRHGARIRQIYSSPTDFPELPETQAQALSITNLDGGHNDVQIGKTYALNDISTLRLG
jgi:hypothetical protein